MQKVPLRPLRYSINITLDGCGDHTVGVPDESTHRHAERAVAASDLLFGRKTYELMEFWRPLAAPGATVPEGMEPWMMHFAHTIDGAKKYVVSSTLQHADWNTEILRGDLGPAVEALKAQPGKPLLTGGITLARALSELHLIDEYEFIVHPRLSGRGPAVFAGLSQVMDLKLTQVIEFPSSACVALRYVPKHSA